MLVIITEDSNSGFEFWNSFKKLVLKNSFDVEVVVARPKNHVSFGGNNTKCGGIANVRNELNYQINRLSNIKGKHLIFLAIDFVDDSTKDAYKVIKNITNLIYKFNNKLISNVSYLNNIRIEYSHYYCYEEIFISFKYLLDFLGYSSNKNNSLEVQKAKFIYNTIYRYLINYSKNPNYIDYLQLLNNNKSLINIETNSILYFLYKKYKNKYKLKIDDMRNREVVSALCLEYITSVYDKYLLKISKKGIGHCWFNDCYYEGDLKGRLRPLGLLPNNKDCSGCFLCQNCKKGSYKMGYLLTNSLFRPQGLIDIPLLQSYI